MNADRAVSALQGDEDPYVASALKAGGRIDPPVTISREPPSNAEGVQDLKRNQLLRTIERGGAERFLPDILMGGVEALGALGQLSANLGGENQLTAPLIKKLTGLTPQEAASQGNQKVLDLYNKYFPSEPGDPGPGVRRGVGQAAIMAPFVPARGAGIIANAFKGAGVGATGGALTPVYGDTSPQDFWSKKGEQVKEGGKWGGVIGAGAATVGTAFSPRSVNPDVRMLQEAGLRLTPGQAGGTIAKGIEDRLSSADVLGFMNARRTDSITDFNRAIYARALQPFVDEGGPAAAQVRQIVERAPVGHRGVEQVGDFLSARYNAALDRSVPAPLDSFHGNLQTLTGMVPNAIRQDFVDALQRTIYSKVTPGGTITPSVAKAADSELGRLAATYRGSSLASERELAMAYREAQSEIREAFALANPDVAPMIRAADTGWATLVQIERAAAMIGARDGIFTPAQFLNAIKRGDTSIRDRSFARGRERNQEFTEAANRVLPNKVPDSGTPTRMMLGYLASEMGGTSAGFPGAATGLVTASSLPYLPGVAPAISRVITARPEALVSLGDLLRGQAPLLAPPGLGLTGAP